MEYTKIDILLKIFTEKTGKVALSGLVVRRKQGQGEFMRTFKRKSV